MLYTIMFVVLFLYCIAGVHGGGDGGGGETVQSDIGIDDNGVPS